MTIVLLIVVQLSTIGMILLVVVFLLLFLDVLSPLTTRTVLNVSRTKDYMMVFVVITTKTTAVELVLVLILVDTLMLVLQTTIRKMMFVVNKAFTTIYTNRSALD